MQKNRHKRKTRHVVIFTSDSVGANVRQFRVKPWIVKTLIAVFCIIVGAVIGYLVYEENLWETVMAFSADQQEKIVELEGTIQELETVIDDKDDKIQYLSDTVNQKSQTEEELTAVIEGQSIPTEFPLTSAASMEEVTDGDPMCIFTSSDGTMVLATAGGTVIEVAEDTEYGNRIKIDHGNGYATIYRNKGEPYVKEGDEVVQGTTLYILGEDNKSLGYQIMYEEQLIDPMDVLKIEG